MIWMLVVLYEFESADKNYGNYGLPRSFVDTRMLDMSSLLKEEEVQLFRFIIRSPMAVESDNEHVRVPRFAVVLR